MANTRMARFEALRETADGAPAPDGIGRPRAEQPINPLIDQRILLPVPEDLDLGPPLLSVRRPEQKWHPWPPGNMPRPIRPLRQPMPMPVVAAIPDAAPMAPLPGLPGSWPVPRYAEPAGPVPPAPANVQPVLDPANPRQPPQNSRLTAALNQELTDNLLRTMPRADECDTEDCRRARYWGC
ncbi:hypothetical protein B0A48_05327 [Cryoendolithus antarcticus]|uniref:Uncharacterized protein n=1 Tax=Cryoendolithus antarcticus TaxID=1507870 RepID=A0A1V8TIL9_9PEZI|nr:hypothetical protein B0A48_05327 [Cryoendolithus antarcticus]